MACRRARISALESHLSGRPVAHARPHDLEELIPFFWNVIGESIEGTNKLPALQRVRVRAPNALIGASVRSAKSGAACPATIAYQPRRSTRQIARDHHDARPRKVRVGIAAGRVGPVNYHRFVVRAHDDVADLKIAVA